MAGMLENALRWAASEHEGQTDRAGVPYIAHICAVVANVETVDEMTVAALHDIVEDTPVCLEALAEEFPRHILDAINAITKRDKEPYKEYLVRVKKNELARKVKIADLRHNMDLSRIDLEKVTQKDIARRDKYERALLFLTDLTAEDAG